MRNSKRWLHLAITTIVIMGSLLLIGCKSTKSKTTTTIKEAEILYDMWKNIEALNFYNDKLAGNDYDSPSLIIRWKILTKLGRYDDAIDDFYKASKLDNSQDTYMLYKGLLTMKSAIDVNALDSLDYTGTKNMDMYTFYHCVLMYNLNKIADAGICLDKLLAIDNNNPQWNFLKAMTLSKTNKRKDSLKYFDKAEAWWLATEDLYTNKAISLAKSDMTWAIEYADKALNINWNDTGAYYAKALWNYNLWDFEKWLTAINTALNLDPANKDYLRLKWDLFMRTLNYGKAVSAYDEILKIDEKNTDVLSRKVIALYHAWNKKEVEAAIIQIDSIISNNPWRYNNFTVTLIVSKDYVKAMTYIDKVLLFSSTNTSALFNKALTYYLMKDYSNADIRYTKLWKNYKPEEAKIIFADYMMTQWDYTTATNTIESVLTKDPQNELALASKVVMFDEMNKMWKSVPDTNFDYKTPSVLEAAKNKLWRYWFLKNYR